MKKINVIIKSLFWIFKTTLIFSICLLIFVVSADIFTKDGKVGKNWEASPHHSKGYMIPVEQRVQLTNHYFEDTSTKNKNVTTYDELDYDLQNPAFNNKSSILIYDYDKKHFETKEDFFMTEGTLLIKPKTLFLKVLLIFRNYLIIILIICTLFILKNIFKHLNSKFVFSNKLFKLVNSLGSVILTGVILKLVISIILVKYFQYMSISVHNPQFERYPEISMSLNPRLDFDFTFFITGLSLIVLAYLLKHGNQIQQENNLTI